MMATQRMIEFETSSDEGAEQVRQALEAAFDALARECPSGVGLAYWRVRGSRRFMALIALDDEESNPLLQVGAARRLPQIIGACVPGGYPRPEVVEVIGSYNLPRHAGAAGLAPRGR
jgi:hypothetical protein